MLFNLPNILSYNSFKIYLLFPKLFLEASVLELYISDCYIRIIGSKLTALLEYLNLLSWFYACTVSVLYKKDYCITLQVKLIIFALIIFRNHPIILEYSPILSTIPIIPECNNIYCLHCGNVSYLLLQIATFLSYFQLAKYMPSKYNFKVHAF